MTQALTEDIVEPRLIHSLRTSFSQAERIAGVTSFGKSNAWTLELNTTRLISATDDITSFMIFPLHSH